MESRSCKMGPYGISKLVIFGGVLFLLHVGEAYTSSSSTSSPTKERDDSHHGDFAIFASTHLSNQKNQISQAAVAYPSSEVNDAILRNVDNQRLKLLQDAISRTKQDEETNTLETSELLSLTTVAPVTQREHVTETDVRAAFGTTKAAEIMTEVDSNMAHGTTTSFETLTEKDPADLLPATTETYGRLTEATTDPPSEWTTQESDLLTVSVASQRPSAVESATESPDRSGTTPSNLSESITTGDEAVESSTVSQSIGESVTVSLTTESGADGPNVVIPLLSSGETVTVMSDKEEDVTGSSKEQPSGSTTQSNVILPAGDNNVLDENTDEHYNGEIKEELISKSSFDSTGAPVFDHSFGAMPDIPETMTKEPFQDKHSPADSSTTVVIDGDTTAPNEVVTAMSMMTDEVTRESETVDSGVEIEVVTERASDVTTPETLEEKQTGFFRCGDGTLISIQSYCDKKGDCPDFSDEDACDAEERANLTQQMHRPASDWDSLGSHDDALISLDVSDMTSVKEIEQSKTEQPTMFECLDGGDVIPVSAVCDKRADCEDYSDEYDCDGSKHVTTQATTTLEATTLPWQPSSRWNKSPTIELLNEDEEVVEFFRCLDGSGVIPIKAVCDKRWDCLDFSDEDECDAKGKLNITKLSKTKPSMNWATAAPTVNLPDRETNMIIEEVPDAKGTLPEFWRCENGNYIFISSVCDKKDDCGDFSDEDDCQGSRKIPVTEAPPILDITTVSPTKLSDGVTLAVTTPLATTVQSTRGSLTLFQESDIASWDGFTTPSLDIMDEKFPVAMFQCDDGEEIAAIKVCDHNVDCFDGSDEDDCYDGWDDEPRLRFAREVGSGTGPTPVECGTGFFQCDDDTCILESARCNGISDCSAGEDESETNCPGACPFPSLNDRVVLATGSLAQSRYQNGTLLMLDCTRGSTLIGDSTIQCVDGTFTGGQECLRNCHIDLDRTALTCSSETYVHASNANCSCSAGYNLEISNTDITCMDTLFIPSHPQCEETNECLLVTPPCDVNAACFNMPLGSFTCMCDSGYTGDGITCTDIDECLEGTDNCDVDATCTNTPGSFTCACNSGFDGDGVNSCIFPIYFNYGDAAGDLDIGSSLGSSQVDGYNVSGAIQRRKLFPVGTQLYRYIFITNSGVLVFSNSISEDLSEFSHPGMFNSTSGLPAVAVLGIEARTSTRDSNVFYHVYDSSTDADSVTTTLLAEVSLLINDANPADTLLSSVFTATWAMVVTWQNLRRFGTFDFSAETNTFQAVLATDGVKGFVVQLYQESSLLWDPAQLPPSEVAMIGHRTSSSFYDLRSSSGYTRAQMFRPDELVGNIFPNGGSTADLGQLVYRLDENPDGFTNPAEFCQNWYDFARDASATTPGILPCPCTRLQAVNDRRFRACTPYNPPPGFPDIDPYPASLLNSDRCVQQVFPAIDFSGSRCVYYRNESLVVGYNSLWESSHIQSIMASANSYSFIYQGWAMEDVLPRYYCCSQSNDPYFCNLYESKRQQRTCNYYGAVAQAWGQGDPHFTTLDSFQYTFNGLGEYTLIRINSTGFELQGRTERAYNRSGFEVDTGTVFTAFAVSQGSTIVEFSLNADRTNLTVLINGSLLIDPQNLETSLFNSTDDLFNLRYDDTGISNMGAQYVATFREASDSSNAVSINVGFNLQMLDFTFQAPQEYRDGRTSGLYGVWNGNATDDVTYPNGTKVANPYALTDMELFEYGETWRIMEAASLFSYDSPASWSTFNTGAFTPMFLDTLLNSVSVEFRSAAEANCTGDQACLYDALATNDVTIGTNTMMIGMTRDQEVQELANYPPILNNITEINPDASYPGIDINGIITVIVGRTYAFQASAEDPNGDTIEYTLQGNLPDNATIDRITGEFHWTVTSLTPVNFGILATDGTVSRFLQLLVVACDCGNNGTCTFGTYMEGNNINNDKFAVAQCECTAGWSGDLCSNDYDSCELNPCYPGVSCIDDPPPSITPRCSECPPTLIGDGFQCWDQDECMDGIDGCEHICTNTIGSFSCSCFTGYDLEPNNKDCFDIDECDRGTDDCDVNGICSNTNGSYLCECNSGYMLTADNRTCDDVDECSTEMPCDINADCGNVVGSYTCTCRSGYQGTGRVCEDIDECFNPDLNDCDPFASCTNTMGYFVCQCLTGYEGTGLNCTDRNECDEGVSQCSLNAECVNVPGSFMCGCDPGYTGDGNTCIDVDECSDASMNDCDVNALCTNLRGSYSCACNSGFSGNGTECSDVDECAAVPGPCDTTATCTNSVGSYACACDAGYSGDGFTCGDIDECAQQIDDCSQNCVNEVPFYRCTCDAGFQLSADNATCEVAAGMTCADGLDPCTGGGMCINQTGLITCTCPRGYNNTNDTNCQDIDECADMSDNCDPSVGACTNMPGGYMCGCQEGYILGSDQRSCSDINECETGADGCSTNGLCTNTAGNFTCSCNNGYSGDGFICSNINECDGSPCVANSDCSDTDGSYICTCSSGFIGDQVQGCTDLNECLGMPCHGNADCMNTAGSYTCTCQTGYSGNGTSCTDILECSDPDRCPANSNCVELEGSYTCICLSGYRGDGTVDCVDIDECVESPDVCSSKALCTNTNGSYVCACLSGYSGDGVTCTDINECELGLIDCAVESNCTNTEGSYTCFCLDGYFDNSGGRALPGQCRDVDECALNVDACDQNSVCLNNNGSYTCVCNSGYMLATPFTCTDILECSAAINPCDVQAFEMCIEEEGSYQCVCQASTFLVDGVCQVATTLFLTVDFTDIQGLIVEFYFDTVNNEVDQQGLANDTMAILLASTTFANVLDVSVVAMTLKAGGTLAEVTFRVDVPFSDSATEEALAMTFDNGLIGSRGNILSPDNRVFITTEVNVDDNECKNISICPSNSMCINSIGSYSCQCNAGYGNSENVNVCSDVNECDLGVCDTNAQCTNSIGSFDCVCNTGYSGDGLTCTDINECDAAGVCGASANCSNTVGSFDCTCQDGYSGTPPGTPCQDIDECVNASACTGINERCSNTNGSYECICKTGFVRFRGYCLVYERLSGRIRYNRINGDWVNYTPDLANSSSATYTNMTSIVCGVFTSQIETWLMLSVPYSYLFCRINGYEQGSIIAYFDLDIYGESPMQALMRAGEVYDNGFTGSTNEWTGADNTKLYLDNLVFEEPANTSCSPNPCLNNGTCLVDYDNSTTFCVCLPGYDGSLCENDVACDGYDCQNGGTCLIDSVGNPSCQCPSDYTGTFCEELVVCVELNCLNNATCELNSDGDAVCRCPDDYTGTRCETERGEPGLSTGVIVGIILGAVGGVLLIILLCFCCVLAFAARRRRQRKRELFAGEENWGFPEVGDRRRYLAPSPGPIQLVGAAPTSSGLSRGAVVRNAPSDLTSESSDNFYYYQNTRGRPVAGAAFAAGPSRRLYDIDDDDDDDTIDSRFSGIIRNMWNMHADQRPEANFDPRELPTASTFMSDGIPRAQAARNLHPLYTNTGGFERPYVADGTESNAYSEETEEFRPYRGRNRREKSKGAMDTYNYF